MSETRILYVWMLYNEETREKRFLENESHGENSVGEFYKGWTPKEGDHLYLLTGEIPTNKEHPVSSVLVRMVREDERTVRPQRAGESILQYFSGRAVGELETCMPPGAYGPGIGPMITSLRESSPKKQVIDIQIPNHKYRVTVEEVT